MKIAIYGYGNLGRGVELAIRQNPDTELFGVFTRRDPKTVKTLTGAPVYAAQDVENYAGQIDVIIICGGSASDLPEMTPMLAKSFNVVDSFDTHARVPEHFANVDKAALLHAHTAIISAGWDPGLFSLARLYMNIVLPDGKDYTFWGRGVSQGHSDAIRRIPGVKDARQYTVPVPEALAKVRAGENPELTTRSGWQLPGGLLLGAFLSLFLCGLLIRPKKKPAPDSKERKASFRTDPEKCMRALTAVVLTIDGQLKEAEAEEKARLRRAEMEQPPFEEAELDLFAALLEAQAAGDGEYALEKAEDLKYLLHTKDVETVDFSAEHSDWFEKMPGDLPGTIRPAFVRRGKLLRKGLFAGEL